MTQKINLIDLATMTKPELANHFNELLGHNEQTFIDKNGEGSVHAFKPVTAFASREKGIIRINKLKDCLTLFTPEENEEARAASSGPLALCKTIFKEHHGLGRGACLEKCIEAGINKSTAVTQWQHYRKESGMAETEKKEPGVCQQIRDYCAKNPKMERKDLCANLIKQGFKKGTVQVQVGKAVKARK